MNAPRETLTVSCALGQTCDTPFMKSSTRVTKGKIVVEPGTKLEPAPFPLGDWIPGRRRIPSQERSLRTRKQILSAAESLAKSEGVGNITMQMIATKAKIAAGTGVPILQRSRRDLCGDLRGVDARVVADADEGNRHPVD